jgi:hypothetical protein
MYVYTYDFHSDVSPTIKIFHRHLDPNLYIFRGESFTVISPNPNISIGLHRCYLFLSDELIITWYYNYRLYFIYVWVCLFLCSAHIELGH